VSFVFNDVFEALYIILLALFHDLTIVTIAYDYQTVSAKPEQPTVVMLIFVAYSLGVVLSASSVILYTQGSKFLTDAFMTSFKYKQSCMFLQVSNSSAILIFNARTQGFSFLSMPAPQLFASAVVSQLFVNFMLLNSGGFIVAELAPKDIAAIWMYDLCWLLIIDLVKMAIIRIQDGPEQQSILNVSGFSRQSFHGTRTTSKVYSTGGSSYVKSRLSQNVRLSIDGRPMAPKNMDQGVASAPGPKQGKLW